jgi:hypothetical protein
MLAATATLGWFRFHGKFPHDPANAAPCGGGGLGLVLVVYRHIMQGNIVFGSLPPRGGKLRENLFPHNESALRIAASCFGLSLN